MYLIIRDTVADQQFVQFRHELKSTVLLRYQ